MPPVPCMPPPCMPPTCTPPLACTSPPCHTHPSPLQTCTPPVMHTPCNVCPLAMHACLRHAANEWVVRILLECTLVFITGRNEVVGKVIFLHLSVILFTGGVLPQCMLGYQPPLGAEPPRDQALPPSPSPWTRHHTTPQTRHPPPQTRHPPDQTPPDQAPPPRPGTTPPDQTPPPH